MQPKAGYVMLTDGCPYKINNFSRKAGFHDLNQKEFEKRSPGIRRAISVRMSVLINLQHSCLFSAPPNIQSITKSIQNSSFRKKNNQFAPKRRIEKKRNRWLGAGVNDMETSSWLGTWQMYRVRILWCWIFGSPTTD